jgi:hypothetical protein
MSLHEPYPGFNAGKMTIGGAIEISKNKDKHFFDKDTMRFFKSRIETSVLRFGQLINEKYFVTSEQFDENSPRLYTVREFHRETGSVSTEGNFQEFKTKETAGKFAWCLADEHGNAEVCRKKMNLSESGTRA